MKLTIEKIVEAPADQVWHLLGERFGQIGSWADAIEASHLDGELETGSVRTCELRPSSIGSGTITEEITQFDRATRTVGFKVLTGLPGFMRHVENIYSVIPMPDGRSRITSNLTVKMSWYMAPMTPVIRKNFGKLVGGFIKELGQKAPAQMRPVEPVAAAG